MFTQQFRPAASLLVAMTLILGLAYPFALTGISRLFFAQQAEGSLIRDGERVIGSRLIGQAFSDPKYFWGRPSATSPQPYNGIASGGSNLGPLNPALLDQVQASARALRDADPTAPQPVPTAHPQPSPASQPPASAALRRAADAAVISNGPTFGTAAPGPTSPTSPANGAGRAEMARQG